MTTIQSTHQTTRTAAVTARRPSRAAVDAAVRVSAGALLWLGLLLPTYWWVADGGLREGFAGGAALIALGRLTGLVASVLLLAQVVLMARVPVLERAFGQDDLAAGNREGVDHQPRGRLPEPVAHLAVIGADLARLRHVRHVTQAVEQLRTIGLRVDRLQLDGLFKRAGALALRPGVQVVALHAAPDARHPPQGAEVGQGVDVDVFGAGVDVGVGVGHALALSVRRVGDSPIARGAVSRTTAFIFLVPAVSALMAFLIFGETLSPAQLVGMGVTAAGVWLATRAR